MSAEEVLDLRVMLELSFIDDKLSLPPEGVLVPK